MSTRKITYAASTAITCTLDALASAAARECTAVDNGTNLYLDAELSLAIPLAVGTPTASTAAINVYFYSTEDGTNFLDNATGSDAAVTLRSPTNLLGPAVFPTPTAGALTYKCVVASIARMFGGILPRKWGFVVENQTGLAFGTGCVKTYTGITETIA
jgi:hypothetical protein